MGCFVHVILLGVGCFVSLQKNMWWFSSTYNKMDVGCFVRGVFCPTLKISNCEISKLLSLYRFERKLHVDLFGKKIIIKKQSKLCRLEKEK